MNFGGFPFGGGSFGSVGQRRSQKAVDTMGLYNELSVSKDTTTAEIKKAYRKLAIIHHPDKGGDPEKFKAISRAYQVLSDPDKRKLYDEYGEDGLDGCGPASNASDVFDLFFGGGGGPRRGRGQGKRQGDPVVSPLKCSLEQIYSGTTRKLAINKDILCPDCDGRGGPEGAQLDCKDCGGNGIRIQIRQMGPMITQSQSVCNSCEGQGKVLREDLKCKKCGGQGTVKEKKVLEVHIDKGVPNRHKVVFASEADQKPGEVPGDVIFVVEQADHHVFTRIGTHLKISKTITLYEALAGFEFTMTHLDGRKLVISSRSGEITKPKDLKVVKNEGMPLHRNPFVKGNLFIEFDVKFPERSQMSAESRRKLREILPQPEKMAVSRDDPDVDHHTVADIDNSDLQDLKDGGRRSDSCDEEGGSEGGQRVQCHQQ